ncbi:four-carbon acid sugar kinase family protein [Sporosarcina luteola]|uniref:four-carbon acid sugar kinase family protein n=1 Tax=Sporosarcina luteola TaxID=582850 RepID=UPI00203C2394|nr:four-carbon acid sugar kinase family protein [Sporosarcina luteola]MCM3709155.1 four-carbon acid sugar kinase family protein [Sporosarcina luteola]
MKIGIIADDLTGANATGVRLAEAGFQSATIVFGGKVPTSNKFTSICVDTDSRYVSPSTAEDRVRHTYDQLSSWGADVITKRIDSTIRGNIGSEIDAMLEKTGEDSVAIVVASYPDSGRVTSGGYLLVEGVPVQETDVAKDPLNPIRKSYVPAVIEEQSEFEVGHIGLGDVLQGKTRITSSLQALIENGKRIIVVDAVTNEEISEIAESMASMDGQTLFPVDPGPLSASFARVLTRRSLHESKYIATIGSVTGMTGRQLRYLIDKTNSSPVYVDAEQLASMTDKWDREISRAIEEGLTKLQKEKVLIITTLSPTSTRLPLAEIAKKENTTEEAMAKRITTGLAKVTHTIIQNSTIKIDGTFSSGGDVTAALFAVSDAEAIQLHEEVIPLAAYGKFIGGSFDGIPVVTKGGMVGEKQSIYKCISFLQTKNHEGSV